MSDKKNETSDVEVLPFQDGGNCASGPAEKHGGPYAKSGIADQKGGSSADKDSK